MTKTGLFFLLLCFACSSQAWAQRIDNSSVFKTVNSDCYFRVDYDNDYFTRTDKYYTQGIELEYVNPLLKYFPLSELLLRFSKGETKYGISLDHAAYTPTSTSTDKILYGDRPFAASLSVKAFAISTDTSMHEQLTSALVTGIIGPGAGGREMQTTIHRWLANPLPLGWENQIQNDLILNYQLNHEKELLDLNHFLLINSAAELRAGTLNDKISGGFNFMFGKFSNPYLSSSNHRTGSKKLSYYIYGQPSLSFVAYDATLQGGVFDHKNPYTIPSQSISRFTFQSDYGIVVCIGTFYLEYCQSYLTKEYGTGTYHRWGGIRIGFML